MTDLSRFQDPRFARAYERVSAKAEQRGTAQYREQTLAGLSGRVIEIGAGNGLNFTHYPDTVTEVVAVEPEDRLRASAERAAARAPVPVRVVGGHAGALPAEDAVFDGAVAALVLCSLDDVPAALDEARRVLRPGGAFRFFEHVRSTNPLIGLVQDGLTPLWARAAGGCHLNRDATELVRASGFHVESSERFRYAPMPYVPPQAHVLGRARTPG